MGINHLADVVVPFHCVVVVDERRSGEVGGGRVGNVIVEVRNQVHRRCLGERQREVQAKLRAAEHVRSRKFRQVVVAEAEHQLVGQRRVDHGGYVRDRGVARLTERQRAKRNVIARIPLPVGHDLQVGILHHAGKESPFVINVPVAAVHFLASRIAARHL